MIEAVQNTDARNDAYSTAAWRNRGPVTAPVVVAGDVHLGSAKANVEAFDGFLEDLHREQDAGELVLLGDVWDMIRRDPFGCAWDTAGTIRRLQALAERLPVRLVVGNHDTPLRGLDADRYDIDIADEHVVEQAGQRIRFCHGNAFDRLQFDPLSAYLGGAGDRGDIDPTRGRKDPIVAAAREYAGAGRRWLHSVLPLEGPAGGEAASYSRRERRAHAFLDSVPEDKLVYGHTHAPYVHHDNVAANPGSWTATAPTHNTYLRIERGELALFRYHPSRADERLR